MDRTLQFNSNMKFLNFFLVLAFTSSQLNAQRSEFVDYLLQLQYATDPLYDYMLNHFNSARAELSELLTALNDDSVREITDGLRAVMAIRDRVTGLAAEVETPDNVQCVNETLTTLEEELETVGADISQCSGEYLEKLNVYVNQIHSFLLENNALKFEVQNMVLSIFREVRRVSFVNFSFFITCNLSNNLFMQHNPMDSIDTITGLVEARFDEIETQFNTETKAHIDELLTGIQQLRVLIPEHMHSCIDNNVNR